MSPWTFCVGQEIVVPITASPAAPILGQAGSVVTCEPQVQNSFGLYPSCCTVRATCNESLGKPSCSRNSAFAAFAFCTRPVKSVVLGGYCSFTTTVMPASLA